MHIRRVTTENDAFQILLSLRDNRSKRTKRKEIFVEGVAPINALRRSGPTVRAVAYPAGKRLSGWARDTIEQLAPAEGYELAPELMSRLSQRADSSELIVVTKRPSLRLDDIRSPRTASGFAVALVDRPSNLGNLGALIRSGNAFGIDAVVTTGHGVDPFDPQVIRSSLGACFYTPLAHEPSANRLIDWLRRLRLAIPELRVVGTDSSGQTALADAELARPAVVLFGNEATGLSVALRSAVDEVVSIPVDGEVNSLNLACAASIVLYHLRRN